MCGESVVRICHGRRRAASGRVLAGWAWHRLVGQHTGQISFGNRNVGVGLAWAGQPVTLRFDPNDPTYHTIYAGTGNTSSGNEAGRQIGVLRTTDAGDTWEILNDQIGGLKITDVIPVRANAFTWDAQRPIDVGVNRDTRLLGLGATSLRVGVAQ